MIRSGFRQLFWGFLLIMIDFRIQGIDILPDVIGYALFAAGFGMLAAGSPRFGQAARLNVAMIVLSVFSLYERPAQGGGVHFGSLGPIGFLIGIASLIVGLYVVYYLFEGIRDMAQTAGDRQVYDEAGSRWRQYVALQLASFAAILMLPFPGVAFLYILGLLVAAIALTVAITGFMTRCGEVFGEA